MLNPGDKVQNKYTQAIKQVTKIDYVSDYSGTVKVAVLSDGARWEVGQLLTHWQIVK